MLSPSSKRRILNAMLQLGWQRRDVEAELVKLTDCKLVAALEAISDLRAAALQRNIPPVLTRVALKFALAVDTATLQETGHNLTFIDQLTNLILQPLLEGLKE